MSFVKLYYQANGIGIAASLLIALSLTVALGQSSGFAASGQFDQVTTITAPKMQLKFTQSISFKGPDIRVDKTDLSQLIPLTQIETPDAMYLYSTVAGTGEKSPITEKLPPLLERMDADTKSKLKGASMIGTDTYDGYSCDIYKTTDTNGEEQIKFWVSKDPKFPFTIKTVATDKTLGKVTTVDLENIGLNVKLSDSFFEVPQNIKIVPANSQTQATTMPSSPAAKSDGTAPPPSADSKP